MSDSVDASELVPTGGSWGGLLFDNPTIALAPRLTWSFTFNFAEVERDYGKVDPNLVVDWVPLPKGSWMRMAPQQASGAAFAEPIESSVYFFAHHRFDTAQLRIDAQSGSDLHLTVTVAGDIDHLGIPTVSVEGWLTFSGITVALSDLGSSVDEASARLAAFTDISGLEGSWSGRNLLFVPTPDPPAESQR